MKERIIQESVSMFLEYGFKSVTMDDLAEKLGVSKKTIYEHFDTKTQLVKEATDYVFENISCSIDDLRHQQLDPVEETLAIKNQVMRHLKNEKSFPQYQLQKYYPKIHNSLKQKQWDKMQECCLENIIRGIEEGFYRPEIDVDSVFRFYYYGMNLLKDQDVFPPRKFSNQIVKDQFLDYHIRGIASPKGLKRLEELSLEPNQS